MRSLINHQNWQMKDLASRNPLPAALRKYMISEVAQDKPLAEVIASCFKLQEPRYRVYTGCSRFSVPTISEGKRNAMVLLMEKFMSTEREEKTRLALQLDVQKERVRALEEELQALKRQKKQ